MKETEIRKYAELMKELELTGLEITDDKKKVRLERSLNVLSKETVYSVPETVPSATETIEEDHCITVKSPIVGVFYAAPAENADPYVVVGDYVNKGQTICIIEAMKLMNEIKAEVDGVVTEVCVTNGQIVDYGTEMFKIKR